MKDPGGSENERQKRKLILFVAEGEVHSRTAYNNLRKILDVCPNDQFELSVVNVLEDYPTALNYGILVTPCLLQLEPPPRVMIVGTLQDEDRVCITLDLNREDKKDVGTS